MFFGKMVESGTATKGRLLPLNLFNGNFLFNVGLTFSFLDDIDRIGAPNYKPTVADMLRCRVQTVGVVELPFNWKSKIFR